MIAKILLRPPINKRLCWTSMSIAVASAAGAMGQRALTALARESERHDFVFVFDVVVDHAFAIGYGVFRTARPWGWWRYI